MSDNTTKDGGAAFPMPASEHSQGGHFEQYGMSLRDWFAGHALAGILAGYLRDSARYNYEEAPTEAYGIADAMIEARTAIAKAEGKRNE